MQGSSQDARTKPWYLDSGCSRHMTGDKQCFMSFIKKEGCLVTFGNNEKVKLKVKVLLVRKTLQKLRMFNMLKV